MQLNIFEFLLFIIGIAAVFVIMLLFWAKVTRLMKKKSHHYLVPPEPKKDRNWHPIDYQKYENYIFIKSNSVEPIAEILATIDHADEDDIKASIKNLQIGKNEDWIILKPDNTFKDFNYLIRFIADFFEYSQLTDSIYGYCKHHSIPMNDYILKIEMDSSDDLIGVFRTNKNFGIHLPYTHLSEKGNISLSRNRRMNFYFEENKLPLNLIENKLVPKEIILEKFYDTVDAFLKENI